jgi:hypothetical protein
MSPVAAIRRVALDCMGDLKRIAGELGRMRSSSPENDSPLRIAFDVWERLRRAVIESRSGRGNDK